MIPFGEWYPDLPDFENPGANQAKNVIPDANGYQPLRSLVSTGGAVAEQPLGAFSAKAYDGTVDIVCGADTNLYRFSSLAWAEVSRAANDYNLAATDRWRFTQFGNVILAVNGTELMQVGTIGSGDFANVTGGTADPPVVRYIATVKDFVMTGNETSASQRVQWGGINTYDDWGSTPATDQSDQQDLPDGGAITGLVGGEYAVVLQEQAIRIGTYEGPPTIFRFDVIDEKHGCNVPNSVVGYRGATFFWSYDGFYMLQGGQIQHLSHRKVDNWFWDNVDDSNIHRISAAIDPIRGLYVMSFPSASATSGNPNTTLIYNFHENKFSYGEFDHELVFSSYSNVGYNLDNIGTALPTDDIDASSINVDSPDYLGSNKIVLSAFTTDYKLAYFTGTPLAATLQTTEAQITPGSRTLITEAWPIVDGSTCTVTPVTRNRIADTPTTGTAVSQNTTGFCPLRSDARYHRAQVDIAAGEWNFAQGVDFRGVRTGLR